MTVRVHKACWLRRGLPGCSCGCSRGCSSTTFPTRTQVAAATVRVHQAAWNSSAQKDFQKSTKYKFWQGRLVCNNNPLIPLTLLHRLSASLHPPSPPHSPLHKWEYYCYNCNFYQSMTHIPPLSYENWWLYSAGQGQSWDIALGALEAREPCCCGRR